MWVWCDGLLWGGGWGKKVWNKEWGKKGVVGVV